MAVRVLVAWARCALDDVVNTQNHLGSLGGRQKHLQLQLEWLNDAKLLHVANLAGANVNTSAVVTSRMRGLDA
jgi:hypothetical protein